MEITPAPMTAPKISPARPRPGGCCAIATMGATGGKGHPIITGSDAEPLGGAPRPGSA